MPALVTLTSRRVVAASPAEAFRAFTHATALRDWLCQAAQTEARLGGRLYLWWEDGYAATGAFTKFEPARRLAFTWLTPREPGPTTVTVTFKEKAGGAAITLTHGGLGAGPKWKAARAGLQSHWDASLENLAACLETGVDLRVARRPRLGIFIGEFNPAIAQQLGAPVKAGVRLDGTAEGTGARAAGLQKDDVLVSLNGRKLAAPASFSQALRGLRAGDRPSVVFYRGGQKLKTPLELSSFPMLDLPATGAALAEQVRALHAGVDAAVAEAVAGLTDEQAARRPAPAEWSPRELVAHLILTERDLQSWAADMLNDTPVNDFLEMRPNVNPRIAALTERLGSLAALREELTRAQAETAALLAGLPETFTRDRKHLFRRLAQWTLEITPGHWAEEHAAQMQAAVAAARAAG